ncbi:CPBP family intramembrane glutamic endopeptidase [Bacillus sp. S/N-304-OC-R1]|uniref:CPBP family intramembrane glutamic endopeptidase n=1 Tax=Bacillus sp. S/N-304-OC-R1 TaxID=2758034 RepID=UPI001C8D2EF2|nr:CPBP family intramembrane glutamic endopeptidase [Bacillus sp. S/N-304-OC-R1]MBY0121580.1 CPBP family intramembrane metalloprotease [Bacillus sp. S/N-304-OC-R1]
MKKFLYRHGLILFLLVMFGRGLLGMLAVKGVHLYNPTLTIEKDLGWVIMLIYAACAILAVKWVKIDKEIGLTMPTSAKDWYVWIPTLIIPVTLAFYLGNNSSWGHVPFLLIAAVGVAVNEEIVFRGILLRAILPFGKTVAIIVPSVLFGAVHLGNILVGGDVTYALFQFGWASLAGMALTIMVLVNKSLLPAIAFHFVLDAVEYAGIGAYGIHSAEYPLEWLTIFFLLNLAFFSYSLYLLKKSKTKSQKVNFMLHL